MFIYICGFSYIYIITRTYFKTDGLFYSLQTGLILKHTSWQLLIASDGTTNQLLLVSIISTADNIDAKQSYSSIDFYKPVTRLIY